MSRKEDRNRKIAARRDMLLIAVLTLGAALLCAKFDVSEAMLAWTRLHERLQLDELPAVLLVFATCLIWFSSRRYFEARRQLARRLAIEDRLAEALAENQRLAQQYLDMQEHERKALARDLHDELGQYLNVIKLDAVSMRDAAEVSKAAVTGVARAIIDNLDRVYAVVGNLIRQLRPAGFDELGLAAALEHCIGEWRARMPDTAIDLSIDVDLEALDESRALALFRLVQEAMTNIARHASATRVSVHIAGGAQSDAREMLCVSIVDNGRGADMRAPRAGLGLVGMRERVAAFGGGLALESQPGNGFRILASMPVTAAVELGQ
jgi:two-component system sensor histidine kinase UhpB